VTTTARPERNPGAAAASDDVGGGPDAADGAGGADSPGGDDRKRRHPVAAAVATVLAVLLAFVALIVPNQLGRISVGALLQIPVEGLIVVALVLVLPVRAGRIVAAIVGVVVGALTILKVVDMGFYKALGRPFDPVLDGVLLSDAVGTLARSIGRVAALGVAVVAVVVATAVLVLVTLSVVRVSRLAVRHRSIATRTVAVLGVAWLACVLLGAQIVAGVPIASRSSVALAYDTARQARASLHDQEVFAAEQAVDAFRDTPGNQMLTALRGKDVIFTFVESYGRSAVEDPALERIIDPALEAGARQLSAAGFGARSAFLTSPTYGGGSWVAHATLQSGLWVNTQQRYGTLVAGDRLTLATAFRRADWRTVTVMPGTAGAWSEGALYRYDGVYEAENLDYHGPAFTLGTMPDQYTLAAFERFEYGKANRPPLMAEIPLTSSHAPWVPIPHLIGWDDVGDGSVFGPMAKEGDPASVVWRDPAKIRTAYARTIAYSLDSLVSWVTTYGNDNLVLVFLGDHQPAVVTDENASHDVPVTVVAHDPAVLDRISGWGWQDGLKPAPNAPVWRMDAFRDRFLTAFGPQGQPAAPVPPPRR
jgi:hypothetical protein